MQHTVAPDELDTSGRRAQLIAQIDLSRQLAKAKAAAAFLQDATPT